MKIVIGVVAVAALALLIWFNNAEVETKPEPVTTTGNRTPEPSNSPTSTAPRPQALTPGSKPASANPQPEAAPPTAWSQTDLGYGDTTAYAAYSEQELLALMEDNGDAVAATAFVERMAQQDELGTAMHMSFLFRLVGSTAAINQILNWEDLEWEFPSERSALVVFTHLLGDGKAPMPEEEDLLDACDDALSDFEANNGQRIQRGWREFPAAAIPKECSP